MSLPTKYENGSSWRNINWNDVLENKCNASTLISHSTICLT